MGVCERARSQYSVGLVYSATADARPTKLISKTTFAREGPRPLCGRSDRHHPSMPPFFAHSETVRWENSAPLDGGGP